jgi:DNA (cytosine-5)-methyltransferase 1
MKVVSLFSGVGGLDMGFIRAGHEVVWANDIDADAVSTYKNNVGDHIIHDSIENIHSDNIPECDMIIGGFPCQGFSVANMKRHVSDSRNELYQHMLRVIKDKKPAFFLAENVKGLTTLDKGKVLEMIIADFEKNGYKVQFKVLNAADYGVPQKRYRVIIIGVRCDVNINIEFPEPTHSDPSYVSSSSLKPWISIGDALKDIPEPEEAHQLYNHTYSKYKLRFNGYLGHRWIDPDKPAPTVTARGDNKGGVVVLHHPNNHRRMSARELACTQSFPLSFIFTGNRSSIYRQIGNAVPPDMAYALAKVFPLELD